MRKFLPSLIWSTPAIATPLTPLDLLSCLFNKKGVVKQLEELFKRDYKGVYVFSCSLARWSLFFLLQAASLVTGRKKVIIPAYTCPTVGMAVVEAGLEPVAVDVDKYSFNIQPNKVKEEINKDIAAVVAVHSFGAPCDMEALRAVTKEYGCFLIEDVAQAAGGTYKGQPLGSLGDAAIFSLGRGKVIRGHRGGIAVVQNPQLAEMLEKIFLLPSPNFLYLIKTYFEEWIINLLSTPELWVLASKIFASRVGQEAKSMEGPPYRLTGWQAKLAIRSYYRLSGSLQRRRKFAKVLRRLLDRKGNWVLQNTSYEESAFMRFAFLVEDPALRKRIIENLRSYGFDATPFYSRPMYGYPWWPKTAKVKKCENAEAIVNGLVTLPLYMLTERKCYKMAEIILDTAKSGSSVSEVKDYG
jgi:dTDP-4-amino-4,6-dideoxygalactose transaminase